MKSTLRMAHLGTLASALLMFAACTETNEPPATGESAQCLAAIRTDECCYPVVAVTLGEFEADPCLIPAHVSPYASYSGCHPGECLEVLCPPLGVRTAEPDDEGGCELVDECDTDKDCLMASGSITGACGCMAPLPKALLSVAESLCNHEEPDRGCADCTLAAPAQCEDERAVCEADAQGHKRCVARPIP